jgi:antitoxin (DNA-binding transcriptional repressor) of toxin-antitoxin stability system
MTMKAVNVTELKAQLSKYLRLASSGVRIVVKDRDEPIAELGPLAAEPLPWRDRLAREGRLRPGTQKWNELHISGLDGPPVDIQASLRDVREDPDEVRRR